MLQDLVTAFTLLTRLPVGRLTGPAPLPDLASSVWAFPVVGLVVGLVGGSAYWLAQWLGMPSFLAACWMVAVMLLTTGAFHEDGLADTADGFGGGGTPERKLEIMRDSRIGSYGALALGLSLLLRVGATIALAQPGRVTGALIAAGMLGRAGMIVPLVLLRPARRDGMAASLSDIPRPTALAGLALAAVAPLLCLPASVAAVAVLVAIGAALATTRLARAQIAGYTGDVLGAAELAVECAVLTAIVCLSQ